MQISPFLHFRTELTPYLCAAKLSTRFLFQDNYTHYKLFNTMKKNMFLMFLSLGVTGLLTACISDIDYDGKQATQQEVGQTGNFTLKVSSGIDFTPTTRAVDENAYKNTDNYNVTITDSKSDVKFSGTYATLKTRLPMELELGSYNITATYGSESPASRDAFMMKGQSTFTIQAGKTVETTINCSPTAGKIRVTFDSSLSTYCDVYDVDFTGTAALGSNSAHWGMTDTAPLYLTLAEDGETVNYTIHLTSKDEYATIQDGEKKTTATASGSFKLERNQTKLLNVKANYTESTDGGIKITIEIDESTNDKLYVIEVPATWV